jgi:hypothetical protein
LWVDVVEKVLDEKGKAPHAGLFGFRFCTIAAGVELVASAGELLNRMRSKR